MSDYIPKHPYFEPDANTYLDWEHSRRRMLNTVAENRLRYGYQILGATGVYARHDDQSELRERLAKQRLRLGYLCACGKPAAHLWADEDGPDWACRVPS